MKEQAQTDNATSSPEAISVLLAEDNPGDARLIREMLMETGGARFEPTPVERLDEALEVLGESTFDVLLLDLGLPDFQGLETLNKARAHSPDLPIVVMTGLDDETVGLKALESGAQDYLVKGQVDGNLLVRSIRYAIERQRLLTELERARQREQEAREQRSLEQLSASSQTSVTAQTFGLGPLDEGQPETFGELAQAYGHLMDMALEQQAYEVKHDIPAGLRDMAGELGRLKAGPRDAVKIYSTALKQKADGVTEKRAQAYAEEGRLMLLQLMGYLVSHYRAYSFGMGRSPVYDDHKKENQKDPTKGGA